MERQIVDADVPRCANLRHVKKPIDEKTPQAAWATLARAEAQMSPEEVVDALAARGHKVTAPTLRGIEGGSKKGGARLIRLMAEVYGKPTPLHVALASVPSDDPAAIVAAIDRLTAAVVAQTRDQASGMTALGESLGLVLARLGGLPERMPAGPVDRRQAADR